MARSWSAGLLLLLAGWVGVGGCSRRAPEAPEKEDAIAVPRAQTVMDDKPAPAGPPSGVLDAKGKVPTIFGWAWDPARADAPVTVEIYEDETLLGTALAGLPRAQLPGNTKHAFRFDFPAALRDGKAHNIHVKIAKVNIELKNSPQMLTYVAGGKKNKKPKAGKGNGPVPVSGEARGSLGGKSDKVTTIHGFAWDPTQPNVAVSVDIYADGKLLGTVLANKQREPLKKITKDNGAHGFEYPFPSGLRDGKAHVIAVKISGSNIELRNSPRALIFTLPPTKDKSVPEKAPAKLPENDKKNK